MGYPAKDYGQVNGHDRLASSFNGGSAGNPQGYYGGSPHRPSNGISHPPDGYGRGNQNHRNSSYVPTNGANGPQFDAGLGPSRKQRPKSQGHQNGSNGKISGQGDINTGESDWSFYFNLQIQHRIRIQLQIHVQIQHRIQVQVQHRFKFKFQHQIQVQIQHPMQLKVQHGI